MRITEPTGASRFGDFRQRGGRNPLFEPATEVADRGDKIALSVAPALATTRSRD